MLATQPGRHVSPGELRNLALPEVAAQRVLLLAAFTLIASLAVVATPRRTGDAHQYIAMTQRLAVGQPPWLDQQDQARFAGWMRSHTQNPGFVAGSTAFQQPTLIHDGVLEFSHFWLYPLLVSPVWAILCRLHIDPLAAFPIMNAIFLAAAIVAVCKAYGTIAALILVASPLVWFVARAQVEMFTVALLMLAMCAARSGLWAWGAVFLGLAATQNLPIALAIPIFWCAGLAEQLPAKGTFRAKVTLRSLLFTKATLLTALAIGVAMLHPAYYLWRLGVFTPQQLNGGISGVWPELLRLLAPITNPEIGFAWWLPAQFFLASLGILWLLRDIFWGKRPEAHLLRTVAVAGAMALWLLLVFSQTTNVNSGGTVHVSRYALWLLPLSLPGAAVVIDKLSPRWGTVILGVLIALVLLNISYFRPNQPERYVEHSPQATWLIANAPGLYWSLPEIFAERTLHLDGGPRTSAATPDCHVILVADSSPTSCQIAPDEAREITLQQAAGAPFVWLRRSTP